MVCIFLIHSCLPSTHYAYPKKIKKYIIITNQHLFLYLSLSLTSSLPQQHIYKHTLHVRTYVHIYVCMLHMYMKASIILKIPQKQCLASYFIFILLISFQLKKKQAEKKWIRRNIWRNDWLKRKHEECSFCLDCDKFYVCVVVCMFNVIFQDSWARSFHL